MAVQQGSISLGLFCSQTFFLLLPAIAIGREESFHFGSVRRSAMS